MTKTSRLAALAALMAAAFAVSACKFGGKSETKPADPVTAEASATPAAPEASSAPVTAEAPASTVPASEAAAASAAKPGKQG